MSRKNQPPQEYFNLLELKDRLIHGDKTKIVSRILERDKIYIHNVTIGDIINNGLFRNKHAKLIYDTALEIINERKN